MKVFREKLQDHQYQALVKKLENPKDVQTAIQAIKDTTDMLKVTTISTLKRKTLKRLVENISTQMPGARATAFIALLRLGNQSSRNKAFLNIARGYSQSTDKENDLKKLKMLAASLNVNNLDKALKFIARDSSFPEEAIKAIVDALGLSNGDAIFKKAMENRPTSSEC